MLLAVYNLKIIILLAITFFLPICFPKIDIEFWKLNNINPENALFKENQFQMECSEY